MRRSVTVIGSAVLAALALGGAAAAHHSYSMFDASRPLTVAGTVAKFEWTNPHAFVWLYAPKAAGGYTAYGFETGSPLRLEHSGWTRDSVKAGDKVTIEYFPLKDGRPGGNLIRLGQPDGKWLPGAGGPSRSGPDTPAKP